MTELIIILWLVLGSACNKQPPTPVKAKTQTEVRQESEEDYAKRTMPGNKTRVTEPYEEYEEDYYDGTFYEYPCRDRSPRVPCFETLDQ
jgi:hypothetical protein